MAGHSKWANIKHKKVKEDLKRGKIFTKLIREVTVAAKLAGSNKNTNPRLKSAILNAFANNMTKDTIEKAIIKSSCIDASINLEEVRYEGYGPGGVAIIIDCMTDNRNRTVSNIRHILTKNGGNLGIDGSVSYMFCKKGIISFESGVISENLLMEIALKVEAEDIVINDDYSINLYTKPNNFFEIQEILTNEKVNFKTAEIILYPNIKIKLDKETKEKNMILIYQLEELADVQKIYSNFI